MDVWSTEHLPRRDRFAQWREERARRLYGAEIEVEPERRLDFTGRIAVEAIGPAAIVEIECSPYAVRRTRRAIDATAESTFAVWQITRGGGVLHVRGREDVVHAGAIASGRSDLPYAYLPDPRPPSGFRAVRIPAALLPVSVTELGTLAASEHPPTPGIGALLGTYFASFMAEAPRMGGAAAEQAMWTLVHLALAARGVGEPGDPACREALRQGLLARVHRLIEADLHRVDLTPTRVAARLGISVRKLHLVFEPSGESFGRHLLGRRLARADRLLRASPSLSVTDAAYASGFESLSTFFRCYRIAYGASPGERRLMPDDGQTPDGEGRASVSERRPSRV